MDVHLINKLLIPFLIAAVSVTALLVMRGVAFRIIHKWAESTETKIDDIRIRSLKTPTSGIYA